MRKKGGAYTDVIIALFWSLGMALGIVFIALTPGYPPDINSYLFGNILTVTRSNLRMMLVMTIIVLLVITIFFNDWKAYLFDEEFSSITGLATNFLEYTLLILVALTVVSLIRVVGIIMVIALLSAPAATAAFFSNRLRSRMILAVIIGMICCFSGLWISYTWNIASGAAIILISVGVYFLSALVCHFIKK
jgi:zinc transport system permease protein